LLSDVLSIVYYIFKIACIVDANSQSSLVGYRMAGRVISVSCECITQDSTYVRRTEEWPCNKSLRANFQIKKILQTFQI
jgi:hypothetical protein